MMEKWRGIKTTSEIINEDEAKTIINRFGQKSMSLPRIDDKKRWAGYPGITGISFRLAKILPSCKYYVEPFAGAAKVYQALVMTQKEKLGYSVLNDNSGFVNRWLEREFPTNNERMITREDFAICMNRFDSDETVYVIDQPWFKTYYDQIFSCFDRSTVKDYDMEVLKVCKSLKGKFFITTRKENKRMLDSGFNNYKIQSEYVVCGKYPEVLITTNTELDL